MKVFLVRHPEPVGAAGVCYGRTDLRVDEAVVAAAAERTRALIGGAVGRCVSSPLSRCLALARALSDAVEVDERLAELDFGAWEGRRWDALDRAEFDRWAADYVNQPTPGGESWADAQRRVAAFLADLRTGEAGGLTVVTHAGVIRAALALVLGIGLEPTWRVDVPFGCVVTLEIGTAGGGDRLAAIAQ
ncbi:MAG: alpha-ribazole phosphatase family protein [Propionibacteriaceae bacterium]|jgi:alpha-ribazole phosphatase|nr:alpha-ribazole phosphatase family protein [Propionibacteriaceae bacterium]